MDEIETTGNKKSGKESPKTSKNICKPSLSLTKENPASSLVISPDLSNKDASLQSFSSEHDLSALNDSIRRSTFGCLTSTNNEQRSYHDLENKILPVSSYQPIGVIRESLSNQYLYENNQSNLSKYNQQATPKNKLSLPILSKGFNSSCCRCCFNKISANQKSIQGEFTLPTNPPVTVTIQPQDVLDQINGGEHLVHDDQIYSSDHSHFMNQYRASLDTSLKGTSTVVNYFMNLLKPSDNKLAMKLFGSRKGVLKERLRQQRSGHCIIHPCSNFR